MRKSRITISVVALFVVSVCILATALFFVVKQRESAAAYEQNISRLEQHIMSNMRTGYVAVTDIPMGETLSESLLQYSNQLVSNLDQSVFMDVSDLGSVATTSIKAGSPVYKSMVSGYSASSLRERECSFIWLNANLKNHDYVDVRILFPNGEDYIVCSKKALYEVRVEVNDVFLHLTEEEILLLDAAIVDANMHGAKIYVTKYPSPEIQEASIVTYSPSSDVMRVIAMDANVVERSASALSVDARKAMDNRLRLFEEAYEGFTLNDSVGSNSRYDEQFFTGGGTQ